MVDDISWIWRKQRTMSTKRKSLSSMVVLLLLVNSLESASFQRCQPVPKYLDKLYRRLTIRRKYSALKKGASFNSSAIPWKTSGIRMYFNLSSLTTQTQIFSADLILYRGPTSFLQTLIYQQSYGLILKDINSSMVLYNRTLASNDRICLVQNVRRLVQRWQRAPETNQGVLLAVKDTGRYSTTLETFYPKKNINVPALALFIKPSKNSLKRYKLIPSQLIEIIRTKT